MAYRCLYSGFVVIIVAVFFHTLGLATSYWVTVDGLNHAGLWKRCVCEDCNSGAGQSTCHGFSNVPAKLTIARTLATVSLAFVLLVYTAAVTGHMKTKLSLIVTAGVMTEGISALLVVALSLYAGKYSEYAGFPDGSLGWGFWLSCVGALLYIVSGGCILGEAIQATRRFGGYYPLGNGFL